MNALTKSLLEKLGWIVAAFAVFFFVGDSLGIVPGSVKDSIAWLGTNFVQVSIVVCFLAACYVILQFKRKKE